MSEHEQLRTALANLQTHLDELREVDPQIAAHLGSTLDQAQNVLAGEPDEHRSLVADLKDAVLKYEASHPTLAGNIGSLIDALGRMGI